MLFHMVSLQTVVTYLLHHAKLQVLLKYGGTLSVKFEIKMNHKYKICIKNVLT